MVSFLQDSAARRGSGSSRVAASNNLTWDLGYELPLEKCKAGKSPPATGAGQVSAARGTSSSGLRSRGMRDAGTPAAGFSARVLNLAPSSGQGKLPLWGFPLGQLHPGRGAQREMRVLQQLLGQS